MKAYCIMTSVLRITLLAALLSVAVFISQSRATTPPCNMSLNGSIRYNGETLAYCEGDSEEWIAVLVLPSTDASPACTAAGEIRFNPTAAVLQFCDGTKWRQIGKKPSGGMPPANCAGEAGRIYYDTERKMPVYCDGTHLIAMSSLFYASATTDVSPPVMVGSNPVAGTTISDSTPTIILFFNEPVRADSLAASIRIMDGTTEIMSIPLSSVTGLGTSSIQFTVPTPLPRSDTTVYHLEIAAGVFEDLSDNAFAGLANPTQFSFLVSEAGDCQDPGTAAPGSLVCDDGAVYVGMSDGRHIFAAPEDETGTLIWRATIADTPGAASLINGTNNQAAIVTAGLPAHPAAAACVARGAIWFLPARAELVLVHAQRNSTPLSGTFDATANYWSSTSLANYAASFLRFSDGMVENFGVKTYDFKVRCVRTN